MKIKIILIAIVMLAITLNGCHIKNTAKLQTTTITTVSKPSYIDTLIILPSESYDEDEAMNMVRRLERIPDSILNGLVTKNVKIKLTTTNITDVEEYAHLKGVTPRGWPSDKTWDDVPGIGGNPVVARIGYSNYGMGHTSINLELHETAHAIDRFVFDLISSSESFKQIQASEKETLFGNNPYFDYSEEYFAESFAMFYLNDSSQLELKNKAPLTYQFIKNLESKL